MCSKPTYQDVDDEKFEDELKPGQQLLHGQYTIERFLNNGGFGITYLAKDSLNRRVVIKECFPESICRRANSTVRVRSRNQVEAFRTLVDLFIEEARNLARLSHPNIVAVHQVFEDNDTAYMAMDFVEGDDLLKLTENATTFEPKTIERIVLKLLDAIAFIHRQGILHRDISPDNILLGPDNQPVLIDFGAARETVTRATRYLGAMRTVKDGYSPQEFYVTTSEQYPSSDLYSLAASLYHVLTREVPPNAQMRLSAIAGGEDDPYVSIKGRVEGYSEPFLDAIDRALDVFPNKRIQSAAEWRAMITQSGISEATRGSVSQPMLAVDNGNILDQFEATKETPADDAVATGKPASEAQKSVDAVRKALSKGSAKPALTRTLSGATPGSKGKGLYVGVAAAAVLAAVGVGVFMMGGSPDAPEAPVASATDTAPPAETVADTASQTADRNLPWVVTEDRPAFMDAPVTGPSQSAASAAPVVEPAPERDVAQAPTASEPPPDTGVIDAASIIVGKAVAFAVVPDPSDPTIVTASSGPISEHLSPGERVISVNGFPISSLDEVQRVASATTDFEVGDDVSLTLGVENAQTGATSLRSVELPAVQQTMLLNGVSFQTSRTGEAWTTLVTTGTGQGAEDLQPGDRIVALMPGNELIDTENGLQQILQRGIADGRTSFNFAVDRGGDMWVATMRYAGNPAN